jgi:hypothetical protein
MRVIGIDLAWGESSAKKPANETSAGVDSVYGAVRNPLNPSRCRVRA